MLILSYFLHHDSCCTQPSNHYQTSQTTNYIDQNLETHSTKLLKYEKKKRETKN